MPAAYYDITAEQGSTFRLYLTVANKEGKALNLLGNEDGNIPLDELPEGFEERFINSSGESIAKVFARMQVRNSVNGSIITVDPPVNASSSQGETNLFGISGYGENIFPIDLQLGNGGTTQTDPNLIITIDAIYMEGIGYGKPIYDIELVYTQDLIDNPKKVVYRIVQGKFVVTPNVTRD